MGIPGTTRLQIEKLKLSVYFRRSRTFQFLSHSTRPLTAGPKPNTDPRYGLLYEHFFSRDEKELFIDGEPAENFLKNDFNEEYKIDLSAVKYVTEKGFYHIFGEFFTSEISFLRNDAPDKTECTLSLGEIAGKSTCPEQESFQNNIENLKNKWN